MIKDYELLENVGILQTKKIIVWGAGHFGKSLAKKMSIYTKNIVFVDSDQTKEGKYQEFPIYAPTKIAGYEMGKVAIVISTEKLNLQESILMDIKTMNYWGIDIYTKYAIDIALYFMKRLDERVCGDGEKSVEEQLVNEIEEQKLAVQKLNGWCRTLRQFFFSTISDNAVYVYQCKKVGSVSLTRSINYAGAFAVHIHSFAAFELEDKFIKNMIKKTSGKVISIIREPVARQISLFWHYLDESRNAFLKKYSSLADLESDFYTIPNREDEFEWFGLNREFFQILGIDVMEYPFDREKGYSVIEKDGISLLLLKLEKLNSLEKVIGDFLKLDNFRLVNDNLAKDKEYRYTYENYLENVKIPSAFLEYYYIDNIYMDHFYTKEEKAVFYNRWKGNGIDGKDAGIGRCKGYI